MEKITELKSFSQTELAKKERITRPTVIAHPEKYIRIQFANYQAKKQAELGNRKTDYTIRYIRKSDLDKYFKYLKKSDGNGNQTKTK